MTDGVSSTEIPFQPEEHWSVPWLLADRIARSGDRPLVARKSPLSGEWQEVSARAFGEEVAHVAAGLIGMGLEAGATVGIMAHTSYDWFLLDMAIARAGLISVPIYETSSAEQVEWIVTDSDVRVVITESGTLAELVRGAVAGIEEIVRQRQRKESGAQMVGFGAQLTGSTGAKDVFTSPVRPEDLHKFGLIPEFIGRLPVIATVQDLGVRELVRVMTEPKNALVSQYQYLFSLDGVELELTDAAIEAVASLALERKTGARGLTSIVEEVLGQAMFEVPSLPEVGRVVVDADAVRGTGKPRYQSGSGTLRSTNKVGERSRTA